MHISISDGKLLKVILNVTRRVKGIRRKVCTVADLGLLAPGAKRKIPPPPYLLYE